MSLATLAKKTTTTNLARYHIDGGGKEWEGQANLLSCLTFYKHLFMFFTILMDLTFLNLNNNQRSLSEFFEMLNVVIEQMNTVEIPQDLQLEFESRSETL